MRAPGIAPEYHQEFEVFLEDHEKIPPGVLAETAGNRLARENSYFPNIESFLQREAVQTQMEVWGLNEREMNIFSAWYEQGVRNNSAVWLYAVGEAYTPIYEGDPKKALATLMFIDIFNRADEVFDEHRELFINNRTGRIDTSSLEETPILKMEKDYATLGELKRILYKAISNSQSYTETETRLLKWHIEHFMNVSTTAQQDFEHKNRYSLNEALALRWLTVGPMTDTIGGLYATSPLELGSRKEENLAFKANRNFLNMVIAWQLVDDYYDWEGDFKRRNINMVLGIIMDHKEPLPKGIIPPKENEDWVEDDYEVYEYSQETFEDTHPETIMDMKELYQSLTKELPQEAQDFLNQRVPSFFYENWLLK